VKDLGISHKTLLAALEGSPDRSTPLAHPGKGSQSHYFQWCFHISAEYSSIKHGLRALRSYMGDARAMALSWQQEGSLLQHNLPAMLESVLQSV